MRCNALVKTGMTTVSTVPTCRVSELALTELLCVDRVLMTVWALLASAGTNCNVRSTISVTLRVRTLSWPSGSTKALKVLATVAGAAAARNIVFRTTINVKW